MRKFLLVAAGLLVVMLFVHVNLFADENAVVAKIGDRKITLADFKRVTGYFDAERQKMLETNPQLKETVLKQFVQSEHDQTLAHHVYPSDWANPEPAARYNLVVIGAGTAGLVTVAGAAGLGAKVALVERDLMGGDCLNTGCVPSKALIRAARAWADVRDAEGYGVEVPSGSKVDFPAVMDRMRRLRAGISKNDSARRFRDLGVDVFLGEGRFSGPGTIEVAGKTLRFKKAVIATGARAAAPPIPGLAEAGYLTNETVFSLTELPRRLGVIGAGPIGCEPTWLINRSPAWGFASLVFIIVLAVSNLLSWRTILSQDRPADFRLVNLTGTDHFSEASGLLVISHDGLDGTLVVSHLPQLDTDRQYQLWLIEGKTRTSGGVFSVDEEGYGNLTVEADLPLINFNGFGITIEPFGGSPGPTGERVLGGEL